MSSDETYLESYIEDISTLPSEVKRNLELVRVMDGECSSLLARLREAECAFLRRAEATLANNATDLTTPPDIPLRHRAKVKTVRTRDGTTVKVYTKLTEEEWKAMKAEEEEREKKKKEEAEKEVGKKDADAADEEMKEAAAGGDDDDAGNVDVKADGDDDDDEEEDKKPPAATAAAQRRTLGRKRRRSPGGGRSSPSVESEDGGGAAAKKRKTRRGRRSAKGDTVEDDGTDDDDGEDDAAAKKVKKASAARRSPRKKAPPPKKRGRGRPPKKLVVESEDEQSDGDGDESDEGNKDEKTTLKKKRGRGRPRRKVLVESEDDRSDGGNGDKSDEDNEDEKKGKKAPKGGRKSKRARRLLDEMEEEEKGDEDEEEAGVEKKAKADAGDEKSGDKTKEAEAVSKKSGDDSVKKGVASKAEKIDGANEDGVKESDAVDGDEEKLEDFVLSREDLEQYVPLTEQFRAAIWDTGAMERIARLRRDVRQRADEKVAVAEQTYALVDETVKRLDRDLEKFEELLKGSGAFEATTGGAKPNDLAAIQVTPNSQDWILAKVISQDQETGMYKLADEDVESNKVYNLPESQVVVLGGVDRLSRGDAIYAVYPDTTSFYQAAVAQPPRKVSGGESFVMVNFKDDADERGITHDKAVLMKHVMRVPYGVLT